MKAMIAVCALLAIALPAGAAPDALRHRTLTIKGARVHLVEVPPTYTIKPAIAPTRRTVRAWAEETGALAAINGGYFNIQDGEGASYVTVDGVTCSDPHHNDLLVNNPDLKPYLAKIFDRTEWRGLAGPDMRWSLAPHSAPIPDGQRLVHALQAGPRLLPTLRLEEEGFTAYGRDAKGRRTLIRDGIGAYRRAARSALGLRPDGTMLLVAAVGAEGGLSLPELRDVMAKEGCTEALNLDGGSSTTLVHREGGRLNVIAPPKGEARVRSVLLVLPLR